jgi:hypothetical protein
LSELKNKNQIALLSEKESYAINKSINDEIATYKLKYNEQQNKSQLSASKIFFSH